MATTSLSLLDRLHAAPDPASWDRLTGLYTPLIRGWLRRHNVRPDDADDLAQDVMVVVVRRFPDFQHNRRPGAFRAWLRAITVNCCRDHWRANKARPAAPGGPDFGGFLDQLSDPTSEMSREWDREHDLFVVRRLLALIRPQFEPKTWEAFRRVALDGEPAATAAAALGLTPNAVFIAKSRVLAKLREEAEGLVEQAGDGGG